MIALLRTELIKALRRTRTLVIAGGLVILPVVISLAVNARGDRPRRRGGDGGLFRLATETGLLVPAAVLSLMSGFLLIVVAGTFAGDAMASDAQTGNLRYLLMRPVSRVKLLLAKATVSALLIWLATVLVALAGLVAGTVLFGWKGISIPTFGNDGIGVVSYSTGQLMARTLAATAYVAFGYTALLAIGTFLSTLTDVPAGAIGATVGIYIVSEILDAITDLGTVRYGLPTHYLDAWEPIFTDGTWPHDLVAGIVVQAGWFVVFGALAVWWFRRKDITS